MVFCLADNNFITRLQAWGQIALRNQVNRFGGATGPDDVVCPWCINQFRYPRARLFIFFGQGLCGTMLAAMNGSTILRVKLNSCVENYFGLERCRGTVQITLIFCKCRKLLAKTCKIKVSHWR